MRRYRCSPPLCAPLLVVLVGCGHAPTGSSTPAGEEEAGHDGGAPIGESSQENLPPQTATPLPDPPEQGEPWVAPRDVDIATFAAAAGWLFDLGLADPRGCEYRRVRVRVGSVWGQTNEIDTSGWVIATVGRDGQRYAVAWNGLVYELLSTGEPADLAADLAAMVSAAESLDARRAPGPELFEGTGVSMEHLSRVRAALLLRLGRVDLARQVLHALGRQLDGSEPQDDRPELAREWAWSLFDRALCAHMRADDALALFDARRLAGVRDNLEAGARSPGVADGGSNGSAPLDFLAVLPGLLADQERRAQSPARRAPSSPQELAALDQVARIAALVRDLDQVAARQMSQPGGVVLAEDPVVAALISEGDAAVDPLITVLESDTRLTRSVHFWRDFAPQRTIIGVHEAAYVALANILEGNFFETVTTGDDLSAHGLEGRRAVARQIRAYWSRWRGVPRERRWYLVLGDDSTDPERWLEAAESMVQAEGVTVRRGSMFGTALVQHDEGSSGQQPRMRGEQLRAETSPSVTELMSRRTDQLSSTPPPRDRRLSMACRMASCLVAWDQGSSLETLRRLDARCQGPGTPCSCFIQLEAVRAELGDPAGLAPYARWARTLDPGRRSLLVEALEPLWRFPDHPEMQSLAQDLFGRADSLWTRAGDDELPARNGRSSLASTDMVRVPAYRRFLLSVLADRTEVATLSVEADRQYTVSYARGMWRTAFDESATDRPSVGTSLPVRRCDVYASQLAQRPGAPAFELYWSLTRRDEAIQALRAYLQAQ